MSLDTASTLGVLAVLLAGAMLTVGKESAAARPVVQAHSGASGDTAPDNSLT